MLVCQTLRYMSPPDALLSQIQVYLEDRHEDQEIYHERFSAKKNRGWVSVKKYGLSLLT